MPNIVREPIYAALFALVNQASMLKANGGQFVTITRNPLDPSQYSGDSQCPVLGQVESGPENIQEQHGALALTHNFLFAKFFIYTLPTDPAQIPPTVLNNCIDAVAVALNPDNLNEQQQTLGGLVTYCRIEGQILKSPGYLNQQGLAIIPIKILAPS